MSAQRNSAESGNAFFIVMVGVVLFAALMFTFSRGVRQGGDNLSEKNVEMAATELIDTAQKYERAVSRLRLKGCSENQISFDLHNGTLKTADDTAQNYVNAASPADFSCHVFHPNGGNLTPYLLPESYVVDNGPVCAVCTHARSLHFSAATVIGNGVDSGAEGSDLVLWMGRVTRDVCIEINNRLGIANPGGAPPVDPWNCTPSDPPFTGSFANCDADPIGDDAAALAGQQSFCVDFDSSGWTYIFMTVLIQH